MLLRFTNDFACPADSHQTVRISSSPGQEKVSFTPFVCVSISLPPVSVCLLTDTLEHTPYVLVKGFVRIVCDNRTQAISSLLGKLSAQQPMETCSPSMNGWRLAGPRFKLQR